MEILLGDTILGVADYGEAGVEVEFETRSGGGARVRRKVYVPYDPQNPDFQTAHAWVEAQKKG